MLSRLRPHTWTISPCTFRKSCSTTLSFTRWRNLVIPGFPEFASSTSLRVFPSWFFATPKWCIINRFIILNQGRLLKFSILQWAMRESLRSSSPTSKTIRNSCETSISFFYQLQWVKLRQIFFGRVERFNRIQSWELVWDGIQDSASSSTHFFPLLHPLPCSASIHALQDPIN